MLNWLARTIEHNWYQARPGWNWLLLPLWLIVWPLVWLKRYRALKNPTATLATPVVVVGNLSVGGTGKTPLITQLVEYTQTLGFRAGVISRGYGGSGSNYPLSVEADTSAEVCGDEPKLLQQRLGCPVVVDPNRRQAAQALDGKVDIIFSDDGLQHYRLGRDAEILVVDAQRQFGNGWLLPVGPLREPRSRAAAVDLVLKNGEDFNVEATQLINAKTGEQQALRRLSGQRCHAVAGIGNPQRFYDTLQQLGADIIEHSFVDHHQFVATDLQFNDDLPVIMTEKDWVKCIHFAQENMWYLAVDARLTTTAQQQVHQLLQRLLSGSVKSVVSD